MSLPNPGFARHWAWFAFTRLGLVAVAAAAWAWLPRGRFTGTASNLLDATQRWDAGWYLDIIRHGYRYQPGEASSVAFFPLYPLLCRLPAQWLDPAIAALVVSSLCLFGTVILLWKWIQALPAEEGGGRVSAEAAVPLLCLCPVTVFHAAAYSESLFLLLAAGLLLCLERGRWVGVVALAYLATLTRSAGITLALLVAWRGWELRRQRPDLFSWWGWLSALGAPAAAVVSYMAYLHFTLGEALAFSKTQEAWGRRLVWPWETLLPSHLKIYHPFYLIWFLFFLGLGLATLWAGRRRGMPLSYFGYGLGAICFFLSSGRLESCPRYLSALLPLYLGGALWVAERPGRRTPVWLMAGVLAAFSTVLFVNGYWFT